MKNLSILIIVLAGTIFGACGKKSSNNGTPNQYPAGYNGNGYYGQQGGYYQQNAGYYGQNQQVIFNTNLGCGDQAPQYINNLVDYCVWLAEDARYNCDISAVKSEFMTRCMHMAQSYNFCVPASGVSRSFYYTSTRYSGSRDYSGSAEETPIRHETYRPTTSPAPVEAPQVPAQTVAAAPVPQAQAAPVAASQPQVARPAAPTDQPVPNQLQLTDAPARQVEAPVDFSKCLNLEIIHNGIMNPANNLASYSRQFIITNTDGLSLQGKSDIMEAIYGLPLTDGMSLGSSRVSPAADGTRTQSAIGQTVVQKGDSLTISGAKGKIITCDSSSIVAVFENREKKTEFTYQFVMMKEGELRILTNAIPVDVAGRGFVQLESLSYAIWKDKTRVDAITSRELHKDLADLARELLRDQRLDVDKYMANTLDIIAKNTAKTKYALEHDAKEDAAQKARDAEFRQACEAAKLCRAE